MKHLNPFHCYIYLSSSSSLSFPFASCRFLFHCSFLVLFFCLNLFPVQLFPFLVLPSFLCSFLFFFGFHSHSFSFLLLCPVLSHFVLFLVLFFFAFFYHVFMFLDPLPCPLLLFVYSGGLQI